MTREPETAVLEEYARRLQQARMDDLEPYWEDENPNEWERDGTTYRWPGGEYTRFFWGLTAAEYFVIDRFEDETDCRLEGIGSGRLVFRLHDECRVVKLPRWGVSAFMGDGKAQNKFEARTWEAVEGEPFLPVLDHHPDGWWLIMPLATKTTADVPKEAEILERITEQASAAPDFDPDVKRANLGWYEDSWRILDYGRPDSSSEIK